MKITSQRKAVAGGSRNGIALAWLLTVAWAGVASGAPQFDAPYVEQAKKHGETWSQENQAIDAKLASLEEKHGKKPNNHLYPDG